MSNVKHIENLLQKYFEVETTLAEEQELQNYFTSANVSDSLKSYQSIFEYYKNEKNIQTEYQLLLKSRSNKVFWLSGIAAGLLLIFVGNTVWKNYQAHQQSQQALADTKMALELIALHLNKGNQAIAELDEINTTKDKIFRIAEN